jgi:hypothetical protein
VSQDPDPSHPELPRIFSDEEIDVLLNERRGPGAAIFDGHDTRGVRRVHVPSDGRPESTLEQRFPHIAQKLAALWPSEACALYLSSLVVMDRDGRAGFPLEIVEDLIMLHHINDMRLRQEPPRFRTPSPKR